jgi:tetratricopeptide (TPR) repeat protein
LRIFFLNRFYRIAFVILLVFGLTEASSEAFFQKYNILLHQGLEAYTNFDFQKADSLFSKLEQESGNYPIAGFYKLNNAYNQLKYNGEIQAANRLILEKTPQLLHQFETYRKGSDEPMLHLYAGVTYSLKSRIYMGQGQYLPALHNGMKSIMAVNEAEKLAPGHPEIALALGSYNYFGGVMADHFSAVSLIYKSDEKRQSGLEQLRKSWGKGEFSRWEAGGLLQMLELYEHENYAEAKKVGQVLVAKFPGNPDFMARHIETLIYLNELDEARSLLDNFPVIYENRLQKAGAAVWEIRRRYLEAILAMQSGNHEAAKDHFAAVIKNYNFEFRWHLAISWYKLGQMAEKENEPQQAIRYYQRCVELNETTGASLKAQKRLETLKQAIE